MNAEGRRFFVSPFFLIYVRSPALSVRLRFESLAKRRTEVCTLLNVGLKNYSPKRCFPK